MTPTLALASGSILLAAVLYTIAVFGERKAGTLNRKHLILFWLGLVFDTTGTTLMSEIAGGWKWDLHGMVGVAAIVLMLVHAVWATTAYALKQESVLRNFHKFSIHVWALWMVALISGFVMAASRMV
jgi:uncharacterized repeat protein (TIGR03987 family)